MAQQPFPYTLANLPAGNNPVSDIDANFNVCMRGPSATTQGYVGYWDNTAGTSYAAGYNTIPAFGTIAKLVGVDGSNALPAVSGANLTNIPAGVVRTYISGLTLSNDGGTPATVLDISAGVAADSTNAVMITLGAFTKTTGGAWTAGTGNAGMGVGLTIATSTTYHVFAIINNNLADVYFDTSVTAANAPVGTTYFRRIGSFLTDGSAHIRTFVQDGNTFQWMVPNTIPYSSGANPGTSAVSATLDVPVGVRVQAMCQMVIANSSNGVSVLAFMTDLSTTDTAPTTVLTDTCLASNAAGGNQRDAVVKYVFTNTSAQIRTRLSASDGNVSFAINTLGWIDSRGQNA